MKTSRERARMGRCNRAIFREIDGDQDFFQVCHRSPPAPHQALSPDGTYCSGVSLWDTPHKHHSNSTSMTIKLTGCSGSMGASCPPVGDKAQFTPKAVHWNSGQ